MAKKKPMPISAQSRAAQIGEWRDDEEDRQARNRIVHDNGVREITFLPLKAEATVRAVREHR